MQVEMSYEQIKSLRIYLIMTTLKRKEEVNTWKKIAEEKQEGTKEKESAEDNIALFEDINRNIEEIMKVLDESMLMVSEI